jgi:hypothetical protein
MSAPTAVDQGALLRGLARPRIVAPRRTSENGPLSGYDGPERRSIDPLAALSREHDQLCVEATDPWEIAAGLEAAGVDDRRARREYGVASVFDLAVELFLNVPRRPPAEPNPSDPWHRPLRHHLLRGVVNALPAVAYLAALQVLGPRAQLAPLLVPGILAAGAAQVLSVLDHLLVGRAERAAARRLVTLTLGGAGLAAAAWVGVAPLLGVDRDVAFTGVAQLLYVLAATALLVTGSDVLLLVLLLPVVGVGAALLGVHGELATMLRGWILPVAVGTLVLAAAGSLFAHRGGGGKARNARILELLSPGEVGLALECGGYGLAAALFVAFPLLDALAGRPAPALLPVAMAPLLATSGVAERLVHGLRGSGLRALHATTLTSEFAERVRRGLHRAVGVQAGVGALGGAAALGVGVLVVPRLVDARLAMLTEACGVLAVVLLLTAVMVSLGQQREAGLLLGVAVVWDEALRPLLASVELPLLEASHVLVAAATLVATLGVVRQRYESPSAHR